MKSFQEYEVSQKRAVHIWLTIAIVSLLAIIIPVLLDMKMYLLYLLAGPTAFCAIIAAAAYSGRVSVVSKMTDNSRLIAHWRYSAEEYPWMGQVLEAIISDEGLYYYNDIFTFRKYSCKLENVKKGSLAGIGASTLDFTFSTPRIRGFGRVESIIQVPIPVGQERAAQEIINRLKQSRMQK